MPKPLTEAKLARRKRLRLALSLRKTIQSNGRPMTFAAIAQELGVTSRERARQLVREAEELFNENVR